MPKTRKPSLNPEFSHLVMSAVYPLWIMSAHNLTRISFLPVDLPIWFYQSSLELRWRLEKGYPAQKWDYFDKNVDNIMNLRCAFFFNILKATFLLNCICQGDTYRWSQGRNSGQNERFCEYYTGLLIYRNTSEWSLFTIFPRENETRREGQNVIVYRCPIKKGLNSSMW